MADKGTEVLNQKIQFGFNPGDMFGTRYQIVEEIGSGGMGKVFKAKDLELNEVVALKMIKPELSSDESIVARFKRELQLARELNHDNVVRIHDLGEIDGIKYISMKFIEGLTLSDLIKTSGKLSIEKTTEITLQICAALDAAHKKGVIHRDLKPQNIMIDKKGNVILLDFGIARSIDSTNVTKTGVVLGTPDFISPEQIEGRKSSPQTDIYSLGIILYEMLTGKLPFVAESPMALMHKHLNEVPASPSSVDPSIPKYFEDIIMKCLEKKNEDRYEDVKDIADLLKNTDIKTIVLKSSKIKKKKKNKTVKKSKKFIFTKYIIRFLFFSYLLAMAMSLIVDWIYSSKLTEIRIEAETYYKHRYPIEKTWIESKQIEHNSNSWNIYSRLFKEISNIEIRKNLDTIKKMSIWHSKEQLEKIRDKYKTHLNLEKLILAIKNKNLGTPIIQKYQFYGDIINEYGGLELSYYYMRMLNVQAKINFLSGEFEKGIEISYLNLFFTLDIYLSSKSSFDDEPIINNLIAIYRELIPVLLSEKIDINSPVIYKITNSLKFLLKKINVRSFLFKSYLEISQMKNIIPFYVYHTFFKFLLYRDYFSENHYLYRNAIKVKEMYQKLKYIKDPQVRTIFMRDNWTNISDNYHFLLEFNTDISEFSLKINSARILNKVLINITYLKKYGISSNEFLNLKETEIFLNDISGEKFVIKNKEKVSIMLNDRHFIDIKKINYKSDHKEYIRTIYKYLGSLKLSNLIIKD